MSGKRYAVLIASSYFPREPGLQPLTLPENDVDGMHAVLAAPEFGGFTDAVIVKNRPHHEALREINRALKRTDPDDFVLIYYSGHGKLDGAGRLYLATVDTELAVLESTSIPVHAIRALIDVAHSSRTALILDCCYSGAVGHAFRGGVDEQLHLTSGGRGTFIMTASTGIQTAQEKEGDEFGLFTKHVINGIRSGEADRDSDGYVTMSELYAHVHEQVLREGAQEPMRWNINVRGELIVAKSGKAPREERRQAIRGLLFDLSRQGVLPDRVLTAALNVLAVPLPDLKGMLKRQDDLLTRLSDADIRIGDFIDRWLDLAQEEAPVLTPGAPESTPIEPEPALREALANAPPERSSPRQTHGKTAEPAAEATVGTAEAPAEPPSGGLRWLAEAPPFVRNIVIPFGWMIVTLIGINLAAIILQDPSGFFIGCVLVVLAGLSLYRSFGDRFNATGKALFIAATTVSVVAGLIESGL
ncbi:MAG: caspase domain-containing protein [Alphaproteobacteria bacterium]